VRKRHLWGSIDDQMGARPAALRGRARGRHGALARQALAGAVGLAALGGLGGLVATSGCRGPTSSVPAGDAPALRETGSVATSAPSARGPTAGELDASSPSADASAREAAWSTLFEHLATRCYVDELARADYAVRWLDHRLPRSAAPEGAPWPAEGNVVHPTAGTSAAARRAAALRRALLTPPLRSHVVDCELPIARRRAGAPLPGGRGDVAHYVAYLPARLFSEPERVRAVLLYAPGGGKGGRSRAFLTEIPGKTVRDTYAGGLATQHRVDTWLAERPEREPVMVVALHSNGEEHTNGSTDFLVRDVPEHVAGALLGGAPRRALALGAEGVSSGARAIVRALRAEPRAFDTVGLSCMACGGVSPERGYLGSPEEVLAWSRELAERVRAGDLHVRFAIGSRDNQLPCNRGLYELWSSTGMFDAGGPPKLTRCAGPGPHDERSCDTERPGFATFAGELHDYRFLARSYQAQLEFHLEALGEVARARRRAR
jgi:hypothetical protein